MRRDDTKSKDFKTSEEWQDDFSSSGEDGLLATGPDGQRLLHSLSGNERNKLFLNSHDTFLDFSTLSGLDSPADGRSFAYWDYDRDGWTDVAVINANNPLLNIYRNRIGDLSKANGNAGNVLAIRFVGGNNSSSNTGEFSCRDGIGAQVVIELDDKTLLREFRCGEGFAAQNSKTMLIGIGNSIQAKKITVNWPSGKSQHIDNVTEGTLVVAFENPAESPDKSGFETEKYRQHVSVPAVVNDSTKKNVQQLPFEFDASSANLTVFTTMATWCPSCLKHLPQVATLRSTFSDSELSLRGIPIDENDNPSKLLTYLDEHKPAYELMDDMSLEKRKQFQEFLTKVGENSLPSSILVAKNGQILSIQSSVPTVSDVRKWIQRLNNAGQQNDSQIN